LKRTYEELKRRSRQRVSEKLRHVIAAYDGSARNVREVLRGLVAASELDLDLKAFVRELARKSRLVQGTDQRPGKLAS